MYDEHLERSRQMLAEAEAEYHDASLEMVDAAPGIREFVLSGIQERIDEATRMIEVFSASD